MIFYFYFVRYEKAIIAMAKQSVTLDVLSYHASASLDDAKRLQVSKSKAKTGFGMTNIVIV